jgi:RNA recognition motif-containing protein
MELTTNSTDSIHSNKSKSNNSVPKSGDQSSTIDYKDQDEDESPFVQASLNEPAVSFVTPAVSIPNPKRGGVIHDIFGGFGLSNPTSNTNQFSTTGNDLSSKSNVSELSNLSNGSNNSIGRDSYSLAGSKSGHQANNVNETFNLSTHNQSGGFLHSADNYGSSFSHLAKESRIELNNHLGILPRPFSDATITPETGDNSIMMEPTSLLARAKSAQAQQHHHHLGPSSATAASLASGVQIDPYYSRAKTTTPLLDSALGTAKTSSWYGSTVTTDLSGGILDASSLLSQDIKEPGLFSSDSKKWPFIEKPPGLVGQRATSSLGISMASSVTSQASLFGTLLSPAARPVSTPAYLNPNLLDPNFNPFAIVDNSIQRPQSVDISLAALNIDHNPNYSSFVDEIEDRGVGGLEGLGIREKHEEAWPKPVRYGFSSQRAGVGLLGSSSSADLNRSSAMSSQSHGKLSPLSGLVSSSGLSHDLHGHHHNPPGLLQHQQRRQPMSREITPPPIHHQSQQPGRTVSPKIPINTFDDRAIENVIATNCYQILIDAADHSLKAVELANTLRARVGTEVLSIVRERWGGLLSLLERHKDRFLVERIPKNDRVSLATKSSGGSGDDTAGKDGATNEPKENGEEDHDVADGMESSDAIDPETGLNLLESQQASKCLHVGNVPNSYTEVQLMKEFEKFGQLDGLKLITQKGGNRRYAFVTFKTINQAIAARHCLSKVHPWKSAISFAHKDFSKGKTGPSVGSSLNTSSGLHTHSNHHLHNGQHHQQPYNHHNGHLGQNGSHLPSRYGGGHQPAHHHHNQMSMGHLGHQMPGHLSDQMVQEQQHARWVHEMHGGHGNVSGMFPHPLPNHHHSVQHAHHNRLAGKESGKSDQLHLLHPVDALLDNNRLSTGGKIGSNSNSASNSRNNSNSHNVELLLQATGDISIAPSHQQPSITAGVTGGVDANSTTSQIILTRLCDDTYVPTQPWPIDSVADAPFCRAVIEQVAHFGGSTTISKLRGFLKHRVGTVDNIKSVPLKAMLLAYPHLFRIEGNLVNLVQMTLSSSLPPPPSA